MFEKNVFCLDDFTFGRVGVDWELTGRRSGKVALLLGLLWFILYVVDLHVLANVVFFVFWVVFGRNVAFCIGNVLCMLINTYLVEK